MVIVGNARCAAPPGVWQSRTPLATPLLGNANFPSGNIAQRAQPSTKTAPFGSPASSSSRSTALQRAGGDGHKQTRGRGWIGTDVMPSPQDVEEEELWRSLHPPLPAGVSHAPPSSSNYPFPSPRSSDVNQETSLFLDSTDDGRDGDNRRASDTPSAAASTKNFAYGVQPTKWAASSSAPLELYDKMTGLRHGRNLPPPLVKHVPLVQPAPTSSLSSPMAPRGPDDAPLPMADEPVVLRPLRATGKLHAPPPRQMPYGPVTAKEKYQQVKEQAGAIRETPKWAFIDQLQHEYRGGMAELEHHAEAASLDDVSPIHRDNRVVALSTHTLESLAGQVHPDLAGMLRKISQGYEDYLCDGGTIRNTEMRIARNKVIDNQLIVSGDKVEKAKERCAYLREEIIAVAVENERLEAELANLTTCAANPKPSKRLYRADEGEFAQRERQAQLGEESFDRKVRLAQEKITDVEDEIEGLAKFRASTCVPAPTADWYRGMVAEAAAQLARITKENELMGYDIDECDSRFQEAVQASKDLQVQLPDTAEAIASMIKEVDKAKRGLLFGPGALEAPARRTLVPLTERRCGSAPAGLKIESGLH